MAKEHVPEWSIGKRCSVHCHAFAILAHHECHTRIGRGALPTCDARHEKNTPFTRFRRWVVTDPLLNLTTHTFTHSTGSGGIGLSQSYRHPNALSTHALTVPRHTSGGAEVTAIAEPEWEVARPHPQLLVAMHVSESQCQVAQIGM